MKPSPLKILYSNIEKQVEKLIFLFVFSLGICQASYAQYVIKNVATAVISANITSDLTGVTQFADMSFENTACKADCGSISGTASFNIVGNFGYSITFSSTRILVPGNKPEGMTISDFTILSRNSSLQGEERILIGAVLNTNAHPEISNQKTGDPLEITVNYN